MAGAARDNAARYQVCLRVADYCNLGPSTPKIGGTLGAFYIMLTDVSCLQTRSIDSTLRIFIKQIYALCMPKYNI